MGYKLEVSHPGKYVKETIEALGITNYEFSIKTGLLEKTVNGLVNGEIDITYDVACKLGSYFETDAVLWINLQNEYDKYLMKE